MTDLTEYIPSLLILAYIPFLCLCDVKTRTVPWKYWTPLVIVNGFYLVKYLNESPERNFYLLGLSIALCLILLMMSYFGSFMGADWIFASIILMTIQYNPFKFPRVFFAMDFFLVLMLITCFVPIVIWAYNFREGNLWGDEVISKKPYTLKEMLTKYPRGFPFMLVISLAFVITLIGGWML